MKKNSVLSILLMILTSGCQEDGKVRVFGTVTLDGQPVSNGSITFEAADGGPGAFSGGIIEGSYELQSTPGSKKVLISAYRPLGAQPEPSSGNLEHGTSFENYIPTKYNDKTSLIREVSPEENQMDFALESE